MNSALGLLQRLPATAVEKLPRAQAALTSPLARKLLATLLTLGVLRHINRTLSRLVLNNWQTDKWDWTKELVLLTGGCSGIGKQLALDLAARGIKVIIIDIQEPQFTLPSNVHFYRADVTSSENVSAVAVEIRKTHGDPTVLINNAGIGTEGTILDKPETAIRKTFEVNTLSHFATVKEFAPSMIRHNHGHIVTVASAASFVAVGQMVDYACTKASALAFHEGLTQELRYCHGATKVRTSIIHPLWVRTPLIKRITDAGSLFRQSIMEPGEVSAAIVKHLLSGNSGQVIIPTRASIYPLIRALPSWLQEMLRGVGSRDLKRVQDHSR
ncbi:hypothetical protein VTN77DRAFT_6370 [Rasamsonia byssochlamydoides]|uniref:uncharacterized protein n=1 Tax=Rasamsonia byssochlamydoides TaxID=89139 RepID=UPI003743E345